MCLVVHECFFCLHPKFFLLECAWSGGFGTVLEGFSEILIRHCGSPYLSLERINASAPLSAESKISLKFDSKACFD